MKNSENRNLNISFLICILALVLLYILDKKSKSSTEPNNSKITNTSNLSKFSNTVESFLNPGKINTPRNVEIYKIDSKNNKITLTFKQPYPNVISEQVEKYMIVIISYYNNSSNDSGDTEPFRNIISDMSNYKIIDTKIIMKDKKDFRSLTPEHQHQGLLGVEIDMPQSKEGIFFKVGIAAVYKNITSNVAGQTNYQSIFSLGSSFNYEENQALLELGKECATQTPVILNEDKEVTTSLPYTEENTDSKYEQIKDQLLGGYPNNLILNEQTGADSLDYLIKKDLNKSVFNLNFKIRNYDVNTDSDLL